MRRDSNAYRLLAVSLANIFISSTLVRCAPSQGSSEAAAERGYDKEPLEAPTFAPPRAVSPRDALVPTPGAFSVSSTGEAQWSMPLRLPAGRNGVEPSLAITYSSKAGSGLLGERFGVSGLSTITRCWSTPAANGRFGTGALPDGYCIDGQRLVQARHGAPANLYSPEFDPGTLVYFEERGSYFIAKYRDGRIAYFGTLGKRSTLEGFAPVLILNRDSTDGTVLSDYSREYEGGRITFAWHLDRVEDRHGNFLEVDYFQTPAGTGSSPEPVEVLPTEIRWTGHKDPVSKVITAYPSRKLRFHYTATGKRNPRLGYRSRVLTKDTALLERIEVLAVERLTSDDSTTAPERPFWEYRFLYKDPLPDGRPIDRLASVQECVYNHNSTGTYSNSDAACADETRFAWTPSRPLNPEFQAGVEVAPSSEFVRPGVLEDATAFDVLDLTVADLNGDGLDDILYRLPHYSGTNLYPDSFESGDKHYAIGYWYVRLGGPSGLSGRMTAVGLPASAGGDWAFGARAVDVDDDGTKELLLAYTSVAPGGVLPDVKPTNFGLFRLSGCSGSECTFRTFFDVSEQLVLSTPGVDRRRTFQFLTGDFDGDGLTDLVRMGDALLPGGPLSMIFRRQGASILSPFEPAKTLRLGAADLLTNPGSDRFFADVDGNGVAELLMGNRNEASEPHIYSAFRMTDAAGPTVSKTDLNLSARTSERSSFVRDFFGQCSFAEAGNTPFTRYFLDFNGDGLPDSIALPGATGDTCGRRFGRKVLLSQNYGGNFLNPQIIELAFQDAFFPPLHFYTPEGEERRFLDPGARIVDLDRDGLDDVVHVSNALFSDGTSATYPRPLSARWLRSKGNGEFQGIDLNVPSVPHRQASITGFAGYGPRMSQLGDFNGDGAHDFIGLADEPGGPRLNVYFGKPSEPDVVTEFDQGPLLPRLFVEYQFAGPLSAPFFQPATYCAAPQACPKSLGWVVASSRREATDFTEPAASHIHTEYSYQGARVDRSGRGMLGVDRRVEVVREDGPAGALIATHRSDFDFGLAAPARVCRPGNICAYSNGAAPSFTQTDTPLPGGKTHRVERTYARRLVANEPPPGGSAGTPYGFRVDAEYFVENIFEGPTTSLQLLSSSRSRNTYDEFGNRTKSISEVADSRLAADDTVPLSGKYHVKTSQTDGENQPDVSRWLLTRYPFHEVESFERDLPEDEQRQTRRYSISYEAESVEPFAIDLLPPPGSSERAESSGFGLKTVATRDARGSVRSIAYTASGSTRLWKVDFHPRDRDEIFPWRTTNPLGHEELTYAHAVLGTTVALDDANRIRTSFEIDSLGRVAKASRPGQGEVATRYFTEYSDPLQLTTPKRTTRVCTTSTSSGTSCVREDPTGRVLQRSSTGFSEDTVEDFAHDRFGRLLRQTIPSGSFEPLAYTFQYDLLGRMTRAERPGELASSPRQVTSWTHDGLTSTRVDERLVSHKTTRDELGRPVALAVTDPLDSRDVMTQYEYAHGNSIRRVVPPSPDSLLPRHRMLPEPEAPVVSVKYDEFGRRKSLSDPSAGVTEFLYTGFDEVKRTKDANGGLTRVSHDALGRVTLVETETNDTYRSADGRRLAQRNEFIFDKGRNAIGQLVRATSNDNIDYELRYDDFARPEGMTWTELGVDYSFGFQYNASGQLSRLQYPTIAGQPFAVEYRYSANGDTSEAWDASQEASKVRLWQQVAKNASGMSTQELFGAATRVQRTYDRLNRPRLVTGRADGSSSPFQLLSYTWGPGDELKRRNDLVLKVGENFDHDFLGRLKSWTVTQGCEPVSWSYDYDDWGNIRTRTPSVSSPSYPKLTYSYTQAGSPPTTPHAVKQLERAVPGATSAERYSYNAAGQMSAGAGQTFDWTPFGLPWRIESAAGETTYTYDAFGARVAKTHHSSSGEQSRTLTVGGLYEFYGNAARSMATSVYNVLAGGRVIAQVRREGAAPEKAVRFLHADHLGNPDVTTEETPRASGAPLVGVVERAKYDPFGERRYPWALAQPAKKSASAASSVGFTGHEPDDAVGLTNMRGRLYDPGLGRFISPDPLPGPDAEGLNRFSYVRNSPLALTDPTGFQPWAGEIYSHGGSQYGGGGGFSSPDSWPRFPFPWEQSSEGPSSPAGAFRTDAGSESMNGRVGLPITDDSSRDNPSLDGNRGAGGGSGRGWSAYPGELEPVNDDWADALDDFESAAEHGLEVFGALVTEPVFQTAMAFGDFLGTIPEYSKGLLTGDCCTAVRDFRQRNDARHDAVAKRTSEVGALKSFTRENFRENLKRFTGKSGSRADAHHVFSHAFRDIFMKRFGIDVNNPKFGAWWGRKAHRDAAGLYNREWDAFFRTNPTKQQVLDFGRRLANKYGFTTYY